MRIARCVHGFFPAVLATLLFSLPSGPARAENWQATLHDVALPVRVVAVDKSLQQLHLFERHSPVRLVRTFPCTTGQQSGDKYVTGDLRTPEGIYFIGYRTAGLDFKEYGGVAYTLNYPNPVDRLRGKTGYGIWIHSKGRGIVPQETRGCVAVNLPHMAELEPSLTKGTAVVMAEHVSGTLSSSQSPITARLLRNKMQQWTKSWASRSANMFSFYNPDAYSRTCENFQAFRANKERLFRLLPWIEIVNREVHVLEGPDYWVTWADQYYRAPNFPDGQEGVRRLYWQRDAGGEFRIVGMEWELRKDLNMRADILKGALAAVRNPGTRSDASVASGFPAPDEDATRSVGVSEATQTRPIKPEDVTVPERAIPSPDAPSPVAAGPAGTAGTAGTGQAALPGRPAPDAVSQPSAVPPDNETALLLRRLTDEWLNSLGERSGRFFDLYDSAAYGRQFGERRSFRGLRAEMERLFRSGAWLHVRHRAVTVEKRDAHWISSFPVFLRGNGFVEEGVRRLYWQRGKDGQFRIVGSDLSAQDLSMQAEYLENVTSQVSAVIEAWRSAWERGEVDAYAGFYLPGARQGARTGVGIFRHKARVWAKAGPQSVEFSGMRIQMDGSGLRVDMAQTYQDTSGYRDKGIKTLILHPQGGSWRIAAEDWTPAAPPRS
jgi:murein L,D-transpeptidase YafK